MTTEATNVRVTALGTDRREHKGHPVRAINIDKHAAIKAVYCKADRCLVEYLFRRSRGWDEISSKRWAEQHSKSITKYTTISVDQVPEFLKVIGTTILGDSVEYSPNSPSFFLDSPDLQKAVYETTIGGAVKGAEGHIHGVVELDDDGNGELKEINAHKHEVLEWQIVPSEDGHSHDYGALIPEPGQVVDPGRQQGNQVEKSVIDFQDLPVADRDRAWDSDAAEARVREFAGGPEKEDVDFAVYQRAFFFFDPDNRDNFAGYKLGYADVIDGRLRAVPRGLFAVRGVLGGARGGVDIPQADQDRIANQIERYLEKADIDTTESRQKGSDESSSFENMEIVKVDEEKRLVYGVFLWPEKADLDGDVISAEDIEKVAHGFMADHRVIDEMHKNVIDADIVQSAIAWSDDLDFFGKKLAKGVWFGAVQIHNEAVWEKVKGGLYKGFSVRISGVREPIGQEG